MAHKRLCKCRECERDSERVQTWFAQQFAAIQLDFWQNDPMWYQQCSNMENMLVDQLTDPVWNNHD